MSLSRSLQTFLSSLALASLLWSPVLAERPPLAEIWFQTSTEYRALSYQAYRAAEMQFDRWADLLEKRADGKAYLPGSQKPVAIILDLDETVIDNSGFQAFCTKNGVGFEEELWATWVEFQGINEHAGPAVPGAPEFLRKVEAMGITPIYISNRTVGQEAATLKVLQRYGVSTDQMDHRLLLRLPAKEEQSRGESIVSRLGLSAQSVEASRVLQGEGKKESRRLLTSERYDVIAYFGDQLGDFLGYLMPGPLDAETFRDRRAQAEAYRSYWGTQWFVLPNPMYGYWGPGQGVPGKQPESVLQDYGFEVYARGRRAPVAP